jgi:hypothetical protein
LLASAETGFSRDELFLIGFHRGRRHVAPPLQPVHLVSRGMVAGLGFLMGFLPSSPPFFPAAIVPASISTAIAAAIDSLAVFIFEKTGKT